MAERAKSNKKDKIINVAESTSVILVNYGIQGLSFSRVARAAKVSRAWLYKYIGKTKEDLISFSVDVFGKAFAQLENVPLVTSRQEWVESRITALSRMLDDSTAHDWIAPLYFRYRGVQNPLGKKITDVENRYLNKEISDLNNSFQVDKEHARVIAEVMTAFRMGLAYRWSIAGMKKRVEKEAILKLVQAWLVATTTPGSKAPLGTAVKPERRTHTAAYALIVTGTGDDRHVLLVEKTRGPFAGLWDFPGGGIEFGEDPNDALHREIDEETGLNGLQAQLLTVLSHRTQGASSTGSTKQSLHLVGIIYRVDLVKKIEPKGGASADTATAKWHRLSDLKTSSLTPFVQRVFKDAF